MSHLSPAPSGAHLACRERMREFIDDCAVCPGNEEHARLREGALLLPRFARWDSAAISRLNVDMLLAVGAEMSMVLSLMGEDPAFMCSRGEAGTCLATVMLGEADVSAEGATPALALLGAWASALLVDDDCLATLVSPSACVH